MRILSLLPAATEIISALGLGDQIVGVSHECDFPPAAKGKPVVTRSRINASAAGSEIDQAVRDLLGRGEALFELDEPLIRRLRPDAIVTQGLCPVCAVDPVRVRSLCADLPGCPRVIELAPMTLDDVLADIALLGRELGAADAATCLVNQLEKRKSRVVARASSARGRPALLVLEWLDPLFSAGHWNPQLISLAGAIPVLCAAGERSRQLAFSEVAAADPQIIVIACCGFSIERSVDEFERLSDLPWEALSAHRKNQIFVADGSQFFNRPGPRLLDTLELLDDVVQGRLEMSGDRISRLAKGGLQIA